MFTYSLTVKRGFYSTRSERVRTTLVHIKYIVVVQDNKMEQLGQRSGPGVVRQLLRVYTGAYVQYYN